MSLFPTGARDLASQRRLVELEGVIQGGLQTFVDVGQALLEIRDSRLYRFSHGGQYATFEEYSRDRWHLSARHAQRLMDATEIAAEIGPMGPTTERQARELAPVLRDEGPEVVREVWAEAQERDGDQPTAAAIRSVVAERRPTPVRAVTPAPELPSPAIATRRQVMDGDARVQEAAARRRWATVMRQLGEILTYPPEQYVDLCDAGTRRSLEAEVEETRAWLDRIESALTGSAGLTVIGGTR